MRESFVVPVNKQRREMAGNVILYVSPRTDSSESALLTAFLVLHNRIGIQIADTDAALPSASRDRPATIGAGDPIARCGQAPLGTRRRQTPSLFRVCARHAGESDQCHADRVLKSCQEVIAELDYLGDLMQGAYGVISQTSVDDFEDLFPTTIDTR